ncbi:putative manganese transporter [Motilimonas eburnea]|uniref:putative manganese transporter n=1 Tax=Motilimonas eburnea TaxID=1737488 RepID=UPI001E2A6074|nr:putative manganese transporter [Motilimonas eburnea]MCE2570278.1 putative manganese transporter [Motilimonas eburnea]
MTVSDLLILKSSKRQDHLSLSHRRLILPLSLFALLSVDDLRSVVLTAMADSFWAVACYVAATLAIYHSLAGLFNGQHAISKLYQQSSVSQILFAAILGALPGCGGAIIVSSQFIQGKVGFAAMVAVLTATMGDAAFLLLASSPQVGLAMMVLGIVAGTLTGLVVNWLHRSDFLRPIPRTNTGKALTKTSAHSPMQRCAINAQGWFWQLLIIPCASVAILMSWQVDINALFALPEHSIEWLGAGLTLVTLTLWALSKPVDNYQSSVSEDCKSHCQHPMQKVAQDTHFISAWVVIAFVSFELLNHYSQLDIASALNGWGAWLPLAGLAIGLLPGCGPQMLVTGLYLSGALPLSTQIANGLANDGDALFPALAMAPKAALVATFYSALPALLFGYGYYLLFEF